MWNQLQDRNLQDQVTALSNTFYTMLKEIKQLERDARHTVKPPPTGYNNHPPLVEMLDILTTIVAALE